MFDLKNKATCERLKALLNNEVSMHIGSNMITVYEVYTFQDRDKNTWMLKIVALCQFKGVSSFIKRYIEQLFGLSCSYMDESRQGMLKYKTLVYDKVNKDNLSAIDVLCRMKGYY